MAVPKYSLSVVEREFVTPNMLRFVLEGDDLSEFPTGAEGGYVKLVFPREEGERPAMRSYTVRAFDEEAHRLALEMVAHGDIGHAGKWAHHAKIGDELLVAGPGPNKTFDDSADWFLAAGDMSAMPAIAVNIAKLPPDAVGDVFLEVIDEADRRHLDRPAGIEVHWVVNPEPTKANSCLADAVTSLPWREGRASAWVASEFANARALRQHLRHDRKVEKDSLYVSCYWKIGDTDEGMKQAKESDSEAW